jgi:replication factor C small subunit
MSFSFEEESPKAKQVHTLWVEKYRPDSLEGYIGNEHLKETVKSFLFKKDIPHLMFYGTAGVGKTTLAKLITKNIDCDVLYINASDENSVDTVRSKIKGFASTTGFSALKVIILDESDFLSQEAQAALRNLMETFSLTTRFILTCNYQEKMIPALVSRCQTYQINPISKKEVAIHLKSILEKELVKFKIEDVAHIVNTYYPDIRKVLNYSQQSVLGGEIKLNAHDAVGVDLKNKLIEVLKSNSNIQSAFTEIRQLVADNDIKMFDDYYSLLYEKSEEYSRGKDIAVILTIAEYVHQNTLVVDKEITFMACIAAILKSLK